MHEDRFPSLTGFFSGHFHQDFDIFADSMEGIARYYAGALPPNDVRATIGELAVLAELPGGDGQIAALLKDFKIGLDLAQTCETTESVAVRGLAREMAIALAERLDRETVTP